MYKWQDLPNICVYCGCDLADKATKEHAPPKAVFPKPRPGNLITVPCCSQHNSDGSADAEYFRVALCLSPRTRDDATVEKLKPVVARSFARKEAEGWRQGILDSIRPAGQLLSIDIDLKRIHKIVAQTVRCLYFREYGKRLPDGHEVTVVGDDFLDQFDPVERQSFIDEIVTPLAMATPIEVVPGAFLYSTLPPFCEGVSLWGMCFYGALTFVAMTGRIKLGTSS